MRKCSNCGERSVEETRVAVGGGMVETWMICQLCGHVSDEEEEEEEEGEEG